MKNWIWVVGFFAILLYIQTLSFPFLKYDDWWLVHQPELAKNLSISGLKSVLFDFSKEARMNHGAEYLPIRDLYASIQYVLFGEHAVLYRFVHLLLFGTITLLFAYFTQAIGFSTWGGIVAAFIFASHPLHVEPVSWLSCQKDLLSLFFILLAALMYTKEKLHWSLFFFVLSLGSKYQSIVFPIFLPALDLAVHQKFFRKRWTPYAILSLFSGLFFINVGGIIQYGSIQFGKSGSEIFLQILTLISDSLLHLLFPFHLQILYPKNLVQSFFNLKVILGIFLLGGSLVWVLKKSRQFPRQLLALTFFWGGLIPMFRTPEIHWVADRYLMLSSIGLALLLGDLFSQLPIRISQAASMVLVLLFSTLTLRQTRIWRSDELLWENSALGKEPVQRKVYENYGMALLENQKWKEADSIFKKLTEWPIPNHQNYSSEYLNLGFIQMHQGEYPQAQKSFESALSIQESSEGYLNLGTVQVALKKYLGAKKSFERALKLDPGNAQAKQNLMMLHKEAKFE